MVSSNSRNHSSWSWATALLAATACAPTTPLRPPVDFGLQFEHYTLDNGLEVVLHEDHSDPIVAVTTLVHVGSSRERPDRLGLAHLFEHLSFNDSENVPRGGNLQLIPELGGRWHSRTSPDTTTYYEVVPKDALEKLLWIDSDRLGYMVATVTEGALEREQLVVRNERQQLIENTPYGHTQMVQHAALYPADHPYHWTAMGSPETLQSTTVGDVQSFYQRFYGAANATLVIAGDIDVGQTKQLVDYWFGEIRRGPDIVSPYPQPVYLETSRSLMLEDKFATLPELQIVFPTVEQFHEDYYALEILAGLLAGHKRTPLNEIVVEERQLAREISVHHRTGEIAGELVIRVRADAGVDLDDAKEAVEVGLVRFYVDGVGATELERAKTQTERKWHDALASVMDKSLALARFTTFAGDPSFVDSVAQRTLAVTSQDVLEVYERYVKNRTSIMTSFVPWGQPELAVNGAQAATVTEEDIVHLGDTEILPQEEGRYYRTFSDADRSEPPLDDPPRLPTPMVWQSLQANGLVVLGMESSENPLVAFELIVPGGQLLDPPGKPGVASLLASVLMEGTSEKAPSELEETLALLGARITIRAEREAIRLSGSTLSRTFEPTMALAQELLLKPRWNETSVTRLKHELATQLRDKESSLAAIADTVFDRVVYGNDHAFGFPVSGTPHTIADIELDDLKHYYEEYLAPSRASLHVAGAVSQDRVEATLADLSIRWPAKEVEIPVQPTPTQIDGGMVYFVDVPRAKQSVLRVGRLVIPANDPDHIRLGYLNERIGGGSNGRLFQQLRIEKGYTYEAASGLTNTLQAATWVVRTSVRANVTLESLKLLRELIRNYAATFTEGDVTVTKNQVLRRQARAFESLQAKIGVLGRMSLLGLSPEVLEQQRETLLAMTLDDFTEVIETYLDESQMIYVVVGDAKTQLGRMAELGYGEPVLLDIYGRRR